MQEATGVGYSEYSTANKDGARKFGYCELSFQTVSGGSFSVAGKYIKTASISESVSESLESVLGSVCSNELMATFICQSNAVLRGARVEVQFGMDIDGTISYVDMGTFYIKEAKVISEYCSDGSISGRLMQITGYNALIKIDQEEYVPNETLNFNAEAEGKPEEQPTANDILYDMFPYDTSTKGNIRLRTYTSEQRTAATSVKIYTKPKGYSYREMIGFMAGMIGGFACMDRQDGLCFRWYEKTAYVVEPEQFVQDGYVKKNTDWADATYTAYVEGKEGNAKPANGYTNPFICEENLTAVQANMPGTGTWNSDITSYIPASLEWRGDCRLEVGDIIYVRDRVGTQTWFPISRQELVFDGGLKSFCETAEREMEVSEYAI